MTGKTAFQSKKPLKLDQAWVRGKGKGKIGPWRRTERGEEQTHTSYMQIHYTCIHGYGQQTEAPCVDNYGPTLMQPMSSRSFLFPTAQRVQPSDVSHS